MSTIYLHSYKLPEGEKQNKYEHMLGRRLLCHGLKDYFHFEATPEWLEQHIVEPDGKKPFIDDYPMFHYNISHCRGLVVCALSHGPVGVDAENSRRMLDSLIRRLLTEEEKQFYTETSSDETEKREWMLRFWTLKESYLKFTGEGLRRELKSVSFTFRKNQESVNRQDWSIGCSDLDVHMYQWKLPGEIILSACTGEDEGFELRQVQILE